MHVKADICYTDNDSVVIKIQIGTPNVPITALDKAGILRN